MFLSRITSKITESTSDVAHLEADDLSQLEQVKLELSKSDETVDGIKARQMCVDGFGCIVLLSAVLLVSGL